MNATKFIARALIPLGVILIILGEHTATADVVRGSFTGVVSTTFISTDGTTITYNVPTPVGVRVGDPVSGSFTYDTSAASDQYPADPTDAQYLFNPAGANSLSIEVNGLRWTSGNTLYIQVQNNKFFDAYNQYQSLFNILFYDAGSSFPGNQLAGQGAVVFQIANVFNSTPNTLLKSDHLPTSLSDIDLSAANTLMVNVLSDYPTYPPGRYGFFVTLDPSSVRLAEVSSFQWPIDPSTSSVGHFARCDDNPKDPQGCYWLSDSSEDVNSVWRDVQPFQRTYNNLAKGYHLGADYNLGTGSSDAGKPVYAAANGTISEVLSNQCGWGNIVFVKHDSLDGVYTSVYGHVDWVDGIPPTKGTIVTPEVPIAKVGNGAWNNQGCNKKKKGSWPYHLHFEIRKGGSVAPGTGYSGDRVTEGPEGQIDPNEFIKTHR